MSKGVELASATGMRAAAWSDDLCLSVELSLLLRAKELLQLRGARYRSPARLRLLTAAYASSAPKVNPSDPVLTQAQSLLEEGTRALEDNDLPRARTLYSESVGVAPTSGAYFNLGVVEYQLSESY